MMEAILLILTILSIVKTKKWVNPASILLIIWVIIISLSRMGLYGLNATDEKFYYLIFIGLISFFVGFVLPKGKKRVVINRTVSYTHLTLGWVRIKEKGYIPTTKDGWKIKSGTVSIKAGKDLSLRHI